ncbi:hypothetical protein CPC08DRAFT_67284 [Agrocybe pediades]|nr:hypothetical protein CPC08DRAFT_67284 [Agrocybe pediades]
MASSRALPEPMNATAHHSKVKVSTVLADTIFVAGDHVSGKLEMECRADKGLGIGIMMVELFAVQELTSRDHSATSTFLHSRRLFQGPGLPPSNAVQAYPQAGDPILPENYYQARKGRSTFLFRIPIPASSPPTISFGTGVAGVRYELRASVGVYWKGERRLVLDKRPVDVVASYPYEETALGKSPEAIAIGENGKLWMQGKIIGSVIVAGESACLELQVKNHSTKKNTSLTLTLTRTLYLPGGTQKLPPVHLSDTLTTVPFRGAEYIIPPGAEGVANLVFDVPKHARGVKGGILDGEEAEGGTGPRHSESLFEIKCKVEVKLAMGMGSKDIVLEIPVEVVHPKALPAIEPHQQQFQYPVDPYMPPYHAAQDPLNSAYPVDYNSYYPPHPLSPGSPLQMPYLDPVQNQVWIPPPFVSPPIPMAYSPAAYPYQSPSPAQQEQYHQPLQPYVYSPPDPYYHPHLLLPPQSGAYIPRPSSAGAVASASEVAPPMIPGLPLPGTLASQPLLPLPEMNHPVVNQEAAPAPAPPVSYEPEVGKGERASRITRHMRMLSRNRSVSPQSHRYPLPIQPAISMNGVGSPDVSSIGASLGIPSVPASALPRHARTLPPPPGLSLNIANIPPISQTEVASENVLHSPRPQLTPKHSFSRDPVLGAISKSERVEELEKMADEVARKSQDLSGDLPKGAGELPPAVEAGGGADKKKEGKAAGEVDVNKTLPGPPVPSGKHLLSPPSRARADVYFSNAEMLLKETAPLPSDQTPPTPALVAVLPSRHTRNARKELKTESGLDALERRLLAEVGTRKLDKNDRKPDLKSIVTPLETGSSAADASSTSSAIPIPTSSKSPEPLHDSAISSLTLAGGLGGEESEGELELDGRTHKAGRSRGGSSDEREGVNSGLRQHMSGRALAGTPTNILGAEWEKAREGNSDKGKEKQGKTSGKKKDRASTKSAAKGRVAAWLGRIDPDVPPQEQIIPPSPSVMRGPPSPFEAVEQDQEDSEAVLPQTFELPAVSSNAATAASSAAAPPQKDNDVAASPNPRSSGFVPISTLRKENVQAKQPLVSRDATVMREARVVQDIWSSNDKTPVIQARPAPRYLRGVTPTSTAPTSNETSQAVSPPSSRLSPLESTSKPLSYSAAARNVRKVSSPGLAKVATPPTTPPRPVELPKKVQAPGKVQAVFPPPKPINNEVKYDVRSARGGRGGKVASVANFWSSGAGASTSANQDVKGKAAVQNDKMQKDLPPISRPIVAEKQLFSAAVKSPAPSVPPKSATTAFSSPHVNQSPSPSSSKATNEGLKHPDRSNVSKSKTEVKLNSSFPEKNMSSATSPAPSSGAVLGGIHVNNRGNKSTQPLVQKRPATAMANPFSLVGGGGKVAPSNSFSTPSSCDAKQHSLAQPKGMMMMKPVIKATFDPAVVSSSHATPTLSSTASLARPTSASSANGLRHQLKQPQRPVKIPTTLASSPSSSSAQAPNSNASAAAKPTILSISPQLPPEPPRSGAVSPSKPVDLAFGQARLRDLIKKYQGQVQKT